MIFSKKTIISKVSEGSNFFKGLRGSNFFQGGGGSKC